MERRTFLRAVGGTTSIATVGALAGCAGADGTGTLAARVSDQPGDIEDFESLLITVGAVWVTPFDGDRERHEFDSPTSVDLTELVGEASELVGEVELDTGEYESLQLDVTETDATLADGGETQVGVPGDAPLTFNVGFEIRSGERTAFTADFTPVKRGEAGGYVLQPVPSEIVVTYEDGATITGATTVDT